MPLAEELVNRGHKVTVVMPQEEEKKIPNLEIITIEKSRFEEVTAQMSTQLLKEDPSAPGTAAGIPFPEMIQMGLDNNDLALSHPEMRKYIENVS